MQQNFGKNLLGEPADDTGPSSGGATTSDDENSMRLNSKPAAQMTAKPFDSNNMWATRLRNAVDDAGGGGGTTTEDEINATSTDGHFSTTSDTEPDTKRGRLPRRDRDDQSSALHGDLGAVKLLKMSLDQTRKRVQQNSLNFSEQMRSYFKWIDDYEPQISPLPLLFEPVVFKYIPAAGTVDPCISIPRPDGKEDFFGYKHINEPSNDQSDPAVLIAHLKSLARPDESSQYKVHVKQLIGALERPEQIQKWIESAELIRQKQPPATLQFPRPMPELNELMQPLTPDVERLVRRKFEFLTASLDCTLEEQLEISAVLLDIPVYEQESTAHIHAAYLMFLLYSEFRNSNSYHHQQEQQRESNMVVNSAG